MASKLLLLTLAILSAACAKGGRKCDISMQLEEIKIRLNSQVEAETSALEDVLANECSGQCPTSGELDQECQTCLREYIPRTEIGRLSKTIFFR